MKPDFSNLKAWEILDRYGWVQRQQVKDKRGNSWFTRDILDEKIAIEDCEGICATAAIALAYQTRVKESNASRRFLTSLYRVPTDRLISWETIQGNILIWNDDPTRTKEEVVAALKEADL